MSDRLVWGSEEEGRPLSITIKLWFRGFSGITTINRGLRNNLLVYFFNHLLPEGRLHYFQILKWIVITKTQNPCTFHLISQIQWLSSLCYFSLFYLCGCGNEIIRRLLSPNELSQNQTFLGMEQVWRLGDTKKHLHSCRMWFLWQMLRISWTDKVSNNKVLRRALIDEKLICKMRSLVS